VKQEIDWKEDKGEYLYKYLSKVKQELTGRKIKENISISIYQK
jgi:hypothetical protein